MNPTLNPSFPTQGLRTSENPDPPSQNTRSKDWKNWPVTKHTRSKRPPLMDGKELEHDRKRRKTSDNRLVRKPCFPTPSSSFVAGAGQPPTEPELSEATSGDSVEAKSSFNDDDEFYILYKNGPDETGAITKVGIDFLEKNNPGIFDDLDEEIFNYSMRDADGIKWLFDRDPVKYQPLARYIYQRKEGYVGCLLACCMKYGEYKGEFYKIFEEEDGTEWITVHSAHYNLIRENERFVSQMREFLFDQSMSNDDKVTKLQLLFPPIDQNAKDLSIKELRNNMDLLFGGDFKQARQRAIESGFRP